MAATALAALLEHMTRACRGYVLGRLTPDELIDVTRTNTATRRRLNPATARRFCLRPAALNDRGETALALDGQGLDVAAQGVARCLEVACWSSVIVWGVSPVSASCRDRA